MLKIVVSRYTANTSTIPGKSVPKGASSSDSGYAASSPISKPPNKPISVVNIDWIGISLIRRLSARSGRTVIHGVMISPNRTPTSAKMKEIPSSGSPKAGAAATPKRAPTSAKMIMPIIREANSTYMMNSDLHAKPSRRADKRGAHPAVGDDDLIVASVLGGVNATWLAAPVAIHRQATDILPVKDYTYWLYFAAKRRRSCSAPRHDLLARAALIQTTTACVRLRRAEPTRFAA